MLEQVRDDKWQDFSQLCDDWGRDVALWLGRRHGRLTLIELGRSAGNPDYAAVGQAVSRFGKRLGTQPELGRNLKQVKIELSNVEM